MSKSKTIFIWVDNFLEKSRKVLLNIFTVFILLTISLGFLGGLASMFTGEESVKTKGQILYLGQVGLLSIMQWNRMILLVTIFQPPHPK